MTSNFTMDRRGFLALGGIALGTAALAGCTASPTTAKTGAIAWAGRPMVLGKSPLVVTAADKQFDVDLKTYSLSWGDYPTKMQALLAGGEIPDVMWVSDPDKVHAFAAQGIIGKVSEQQIAQYAPKLKAAIDKLWPQGWYYGQYKGSNYGFPTYYTGRWTSASVWRTDLLKSAGIDALPSTLGEAEDAFAALKDKGITAMSSAGPSYFAAFHTIFGAHGVMPTAWQMVDGKIINGAVRDEAKETLSLLQKWYKAGYIDQEFMSNVSQAQLQKLINGEVAFYDYGSFNSTDTKNPNSVVSAARINNPNASVGLTKPLKGPAGRGAWAWGTAGNIMTFSAKAAKDEEKVKKILGIFEAIYSDDKVGLKYALGKEDSTYKLTDPAKGIEGGWEWLGEYTDPVKQEAAGLGALPYIGFPSAKITDLLAIPDASLREVQSKLGNNGIVDYFGKSMSVENSEKYWANLTNLKVKTYADIIQGSQPVSSFDNFVKQWNSNGGAELQKSAEKLAEKKN